MFISEQYLTEMSVTVKYKRKLFDAIVCPNSGLYFLADFNDWSIEWAEYVALEEDIDKITEDHWKVIHFIRSYYSKYNRPPRLRTIFRKTGFKLMHIYELFPNGPGRGAGRMAGLPYKQLPI